jgi:probable HAF family extracellular repeat protein
MHLLNRWGVVHALWIGAATCALPAAAAPLYAYTPLTVAGAEFSTARALNDAGQAVGWATTANGIDATLWSGGVGTLLPRPPNTLGSSAYAINASGQVAGSTSIGMGRYMERAVVWDGGAASIVGPLDRAFGINASGMLAGEGPGRGFFLAPWSWRDGVATELPSGGGVTGSAYALNDSGQVVGYNGDAQEQPRATLWSGNGLLDLGVSGAAHAINASGQVAGVSWEGPAPRAFLWSPQGLAWLDAPGSAAGWAQGINDRGQVVGTGNEEALLWSEGVRYELNDLLAPGALEPGWQLWSAADINNRGWIVGDAYNPQTGQTRGYLLTPLADQQVPEPRSLALVLLGLGALLMWQRRLASA